MEDMGWFDWVYNGVDFTLPGNGGSECRDYLGLLQRFTESIIVNVLALVVVISAVPNLKLPTLLPNNHQKPESLGKRLLLILMCLTFGIELGFKFATRQMIWIWNPCHLTSMLQIFILAAPPSRLVTAAFRLHNHMLTGATLAILFPVINTRLLPFEASTYFIQHILMLIIPFYLMKTGDPFIPEDLTDFSWCMVSCGFQYIYHFLPLQLLAYFTEVNLNNMLCPAVSDPFHGKYYRLFAIAIQLVHIPLQGKGVVIIAKAFGLIPQDNPCTPSRAAVLSVTEETEYCSNSAKITRCSSPVSQASSTKLFLDEFDDSGFQGAGCALGSKRTGSESQSDDDISYGSLTETLAAGVEEKTNIVVKRLVNSCFIGDGDISPTRKNSLGCTNKLEASPNLQNGRNGHAKLH